MPPIPWQARKPWFQLWVPVFLLAYVLFNGAGHMMAAYKVTLEYPCRETQYLLKASGYLHGGWGLLGTFVLLTLAYASWKLCPQWSDGIRWSAGMMSWVLILLLLLIQAALIAPYGWGFPLPPNSEIRLYLAQIWRPHPIRFSLEKDFARFLKDANPNVSEKASMELIQLKAKECLPNIAKLLKYDDFSVRCHAVVVLEQLKAKEFAPDVAELLKDSHAEVRRVVAETIGKLEAREFAPDIAKLLKDGNAAVRGTAAGALRHLEAKEFSPHIAALLQDGDATVRSTATWVLGQLGAKEFAPDIAKLLEDPAPSVRKQATEALKALSSQ